MLAALLGVSAGRFVVEPDITPFRGDFEGLPAEILKPPIERARRALSAISAGALVGVTRVQIAPLAIEGYLACTPEPARGLLQKIVAGASPRDLITSGSVAPRLLEAVLSDAARRGAIKDVERTGSEPSPPRAARCHPSSRSALETSIIPSPVREIRAGSPPATSKPPETSEEDAGWFSFQLDTGAPAAVAERAVARAGLALGGRTFETGERCRRAAEPQPAPVEGHGKALPFSAEVTPSVDRLWDTITEGVFNDPGTLQGVGELPEVAVAAAAAARAHAPSRLLRCVRHGARAAGFASTEPRPGIGRLKRAAPVPKSDPKIWTRSAMPC